MLRRYILNKTNTFINYRYASQSMLQSTIDDKLGIATLVMNKPPVNSLNLEFLEEIKSQLTQFKNDKIRGMILTSDLQKIFCAGLDITEFSNPNPERLSKICTTFQDTWLALYLTQFPTVAVINGHSPAGGCLLAMSCDYRVMVGPNYTIGLNETKLGIVAPKWFQDCMVAVIGQRKAEVSLTTGKMYTTDQALQIGLVDESVPDVDNAINKGIQFLNNFQKISPWAYKMTKDIRRQPTVQWLIDNKQKDLDFVVKSMMSPNVQKSIGLYLQSLKK
ncbi:Enoyl-CoA hydratase/isomerase, conserved site,Crotonase superfamily,ClpP/crotonase-like domain [Cinara cedri]|uniref:Enoyl-CoA delta isomerase 1, mitochondrial n=1 Tax=Cinara cedri TaxID=506608 RepID=A0A5E4MVZ2_9HEMI|nr:Enoyl-CoA hydratase/isomerase, conserved site,Crotonase superfamily,ClpP/crotonase-like domain [Cinara cedri]